MQSFKIKNRVIGKGQPTFIVAELSGNHHQKHEEAVELIKNAAEAGVDVRELVSYMIQTPRHPKYIV